MGGIHGVASILWVVVAVMVILNVICILINTFSKGDKK